jgi:hypothetical protein
MWATKKTNLLVVIIFVLLQFNKEKKLTNEF